MAHFLDTKNKQKATALTFLVISIFLFFIFIFGLKYLDPPEEYGIAVNFGTSNVGSGDNQPQAEEVIQENTPQEVIEPIEKSAPPEETQEVENEEAEASDDLEEVVTQPDGEVIKAAEKKKEEIRKEQEREKKQKAEREQERIEQEKREQVEREVKERVEREKREALEKKKKLDNLIGGINNAQNSNSGEGDDKVAGDKGKINGDPNAKGYYGNGGSGGNDYQLGNRKPLSRPKPEYICDEEGLVVVRIEVNMNGRVIKATPGVKGSTNTAQCLLSQAKDAALKTRWQSDTDAPTKQVGIIKYRFSLSK